MIYLLYGEESYLIEQEVNNLKGKFKDCSLEKFDEVPAKELIESLQTPCLFASSRLILASRIDFAEDEEELLKTLDNLDSSIKLVFISPCNLDARKRLYKFIENNGEIKEFKAFADWETDQVASWIVRRINSCSKKITPQAAELLVGISGKNLQNLNSEIEKLITYCGEEVNIKEEDVLKTACQTEVHVFSFINALKEKNIKKAIDLSERILKNHDPVIPLLSAAASQFRVLLSVKLLLDRGWDRFRIARELGLNPFYVKKNIEQAGLFTQEKLRLILEAFYKSDTKAKKGESTRVILPLLISTIRDRSLSNE